MLFLFNLMEDGRKIERVEGLMDGKFFFFFFMAFWP